MKRFSRVLFVLMSVLLLMSFVGCSEDEGDGDNDGSTTYIVSYDGNGSTGGVVPVDSGSYLQGQTITTLGNTGSLVKTGAAFANWNTRADGSGTTYTPDQVFFMGSGNVTLYAQWSTTFYTVLFDSQGATTPASPTSISVDCNTILASFPIAPLLTGYVFGGWFTAVSGGGTEFITSTVVTTDITLYAEWTAIIYTITYDDQSATTPVNPGTDNVAYGSTVVSLPTAPLKTGYAFGGWTNSSGGVFDATNIVTNDIIVYAKWYMGYVLRDIGPAGGLIFYDKGNSSYGWRYLEAAPLSTEWAGKEWGSYEYSIGGTSTAIGSGQANTTIIVNWLDSNVDNSNGDVSNKTNRAAFLCDALIYGGYDDWFLPSMDELNKMYLNLKSGTDENSVVYTPVGGFYTEDYWSSSEYSDNSYVWSQRFLSGGQNFTNKGNIFSVRAVRAF